MTTVWASAGRRYHRIARCPALEHGQELHDWDCNEPCSHYHPGPRAVREISETLAHAYGLTPCSSCLPGVHDWDSPTFGHEPMLVRHFGARREPHAEFVACERCYPRNTHWPCATARILRLDGLS